MTTTLKIPREWASNTNYSTGLDSGTPTKVDAATPTDGFIRGTAAAPQHVNFELNAHALAARRALTATLLQLRYLPIETGTTLTDTAEGMAAVSVGAGGRTLLVKTAQSFLTADQLRASAAGVPASITALVSDAANSGSRILVVGGGGNRCTYSDDGGATWTAGANIGTSPIPRLVWNPVYSRFIGVVSGARWKFSADGVAAWTTSTGTQISVNGGMGILSNGNIYSPGPGLVTPSNFTVSADGGTTGSATGGGVPNAADFDENGYIAGVGGSLLYHAGSKLAGTKMQVSYSADGIAWSSIAEFSPPSGCTFVSHTRLLMCPDTGLLVIVAPVTTAFSAAELAMYASVDGVTWLGPSFVYPGAADGGGFAIANGRVFCTRDDLFFATDGCGL